MAKRAKTKPLAQQLLPRLLETIGRPLYLAIVIVLQIVEFVGRSTRVAFGTLLPRPGSLYNFVSIKTWLKKIRGYLLWEVKAGPEINFKKFVEGFDFWRKKLSRRLAYFKRKIDRKNVYWRRWLKRKKNYLLKKKVGRSISFPAVLIVVVVLGVSGLSYSVFRDLPSPHDLVDRNIEVSTKIYDRNGKLLYKIFKDKNRTIVPLEEIPIYVRLATLAIEDAEFYTHSGISYRGIIRALWRNLTRGELSGGSTITQQLVKNALLSPEKTFRRKARETLLAIKVEFAFTKDEILEMYLNEVSYGGTAYGIQEASQAYFGKTVDKLTLGEAAVLAGLPKSPTRYSPFGPNPEDSLERQKEVLRLMKINGYITKEQYEKTLKEKIKFAPNKDKIFAPHFVMYIRQMLEEKYGKSVVETGGLEVITTLDYDIQKMAERFVSEEIDRLSGLSVGNGAALVLNPRTGEILAMVGSKDYFDIENDGNVNVTTRLRQPGSSIKLINYAYALSHDYTPATIINDSPITFKVLGSKPYSPRNYDGKFLGNLTLRSAFAQSRNVTAVKVLASYGVEKMVEMGRRMGITTWNDPSNYGLSLTLGGGEVRLIDLAQAYATVANYGRRPKLSSILKVTNYKGSVLEKFSCGSENAFAGLGAVEASEFSTKECGGERVLDPRVAYQLISILSDNSARTPAFGSRSALVIPNHKEVAVKTGTSNDLRDNLTVGFNQNYLTAVWVGNNDNSPMSRIASGITGASPIWNKIMTNLLSAQPNHDWVVPEGLVQLSICTITGTLTCSGCPTVNEWLKEESAPTRRCSPEVIKAIVAKRAEKKEGEGRITPEAAATQR